MLNNHIVKSEIEILMKKMVDHQYSPLFLQPIEEIVNAYPNYSILISQPIDLGKIQKKLEENIYSTIDEIKNDVDLMINNCKTFNSIKKSWAHKAAESLEGFFSRELKKTIQKIDKLSQIASQPPKVKHESSIQNKNYQSENNIQVVSSAEDEIILNKLRNLFVKIRSNLNVTDEQLDDSTALIAKFIVKRNKSFEEIYDDTMKFINKNLINSPNNLKSYFSKKFRKMLRTIKEEQNEGASKEVLNIKINLNETEEKRQELEKLNELNKEIYDFIENQKIPETLRNVSEYPIEPSLRKKIYSHVLDIRKSFMSNY